MLEEKDNEKKPQKIEIVKGNSKDLNISEVKDNLVLESPEENIKQNIIIPENINQADNSNENNN